jgi:uridine phosphorylase
LPEPTSAIHIHPTAELAPRVLLPGDPGRALELAQSKLGEPRMFNHHRGLWGYTGVAPDGEPLTIQATGMGGPSAAIVLSELIELGARCAIRVGTCGALAPGIELGDLLVASESICGDGTSRALGAGERASADPALVERLRRSAPAARTGVVESVDLFYDPDPHPHPDALAIEMEAAALFAVGARAGVPVACVLAVTDTFGPRGERHRIDEQTLLDAVGRMGEAAVGALCAPGASSP